jgi:hypothetical protein
MKKSSLVLLALVPLICMGAIAIAEEVTLEGIKCVIAPRDAKLANSAEWKDGKVYFCCAGCKGKFEKMSKEDKEKMASKSNAQLVATKQYTQKACPISGGDLNPETAIEVAGCKVAFCCKNCKGKVEGQEADQQVETVFGQKAFETAKFSKVEAK